MRRTILGILIFLIILLLFSLYLRRYRGRAIKCYENVENSKKISIGMNEKEFIKIMGKPDSIFEEYSDNKLRIYYYEPPFASSSGIDIYVDSSNKVCKIIYFE
jgi:hypothetical protein